MAGLIDFGAQQGLNYGSLIQSFGAGQEAKLQRGQIARQTRIDDRQDRQEQREVAQQAALAGAVGPDGNIDYGKVKGALVASGDVKGAMDIDTTMRTAQKAKLDYAIAENGAVVQLLGSATDQASYDRARSRAGELGLNVEGLPPQFDAAAIGQMQTQALSAADQLKAKRDERDFELRKADTEADNLRGDRQVEVALRGQDRAAADAAAGRAVTIRGQDRTDARAREKNSIDAGGVGRGARKAEGDVRKEFNSLPDVKAFNEVRASFSGIKAAAASPSAANDISLIFSYMKMLDPGSVVREGEFANAQNAASVDDRVRNAYNKAVTGQRLNPKQRREFVGSARDVFSSRRARYNSVVDEYRGYASDYGVNPDRVAKPEFVGRKISAPTGAVDALVGNPRLAADFDKKYGRGAAAAYLADAGPK